MVHVIYNTVEKYIENRNVNLDNYNKGKIEEGKIEEGKIKLCKTLFDEMLEDVVDDKKIKYFIDDVIYVIYKNYVILFNFTFLSLNIFRSNYKSIIINIIKQFNSYYDTNCERIHKLIINKYISLKGDKINPSIEEDKIYTEVKDNPVDNPVDNPEDNPEDCSICFNEIDINEKKTILSCNHIFHTKCIDTWFGIKKNCPLCRKEQGDNTGGNYKNNKKIKSYKKRLTNYTLEKLKQVATNKKIKYRQNISKKTIIKKLIKHKYDI